ncbi:hypothetical protein EDB83DRAFT_2681126 [Lactarius deliciosus]|nr:hypothetical protein EDB83DRAFT_2681126 [Lactarius deliciosus]
MTKKTSLKVLTLRLSAQPVDEEVGRGEAYEMSTHTKALVEPPNDAPTGPNSKLAGDIDQPGDNDGTPNSSAQPMPPGMLRMIGDFNDNANALWSLQLKEAMSHDEARIQSLRDDMDGVLVFVRDYIKLPSSRSSRTHALSSRPVYFPPLSLPFSLIRFTTFNPIRRSRWSSPSNFPLSHHRSPSIPPPSYVFDLYPSDVRVNVFWFMSLVFSVSATLVQQWVRDYMHVLQRYSNPLKSARLRQYLYEGAEGWYMPVVAASVPGLVHVFLFLFSLGLGDLLLNINTTVGVTTVLPITICAFLYMFTVFAPVVKPQAPFRNPFSGLI